MAFTPGCATRSLVIHLNERQYERSEVFILQLRGFQSFYYSIYLSRFILFFYLYP